MGKKKKKKQKKMEKKSLELLREVDDSLTTTYDSLIEEIQTIQENIWIADCKSMEKERNKLRNNEIKNSMGLLPYYVCPERVEVRKESLLQMERTNLLDRVEETISQIKPVVVIVSRLISALIVSLLSVTTFKRMISPKTLERLEFVYNIAMKAGNLVAGTMKDDESEDVRSDEQ